MAYKSVFVCDVCQREEETPSEYQIKPPNWWSLLREPGPGRAPTNKTFCCKDCLESWLEMGG